MTRSAFRAFVSFLVAVGICATVAPASWAQRDSEKSSTPSLLIVIEALRPEFLSPTLMPNLHALSKRGALFQSQHAVFPTTSSVNAASIATGAYPASHGLLGNSVLFPELGADAIFDTRDADSLRKIQAATNGKVLTVPSLGELFRAQDKKLLVVSAGNASTTFLLDPNSIQSELRAGQASPTADSAGARDAWAVDTYFELGLAQIKPDVSILWLAEVAAIQSVEGLGAPKSLEAIRAADDRIGAILKRHKELRIKVNIFVTSDRGTSTRQGEADLNQFLIQEGLKESATSRDVIVVDNSSIFIEGHDRTRIKNILQRLQRHQDIGAIYTQQARLTHPESFVPGALSFQAVFMDHPRAPDILVEPAWSDQSNAEGYPGSTRGFGTGADGSSSPYDLKTILVAAGPDIRRGVESTVPTAHIDLAPTLCFLHDLKPPESMDGRVLHEVLRGGPKPESVKVLTRRNGSQATWDGGRYRLIMSEITVEGVDYLDFTKVQGN